MKEVLALILRQLRERSLWQDGPVGVGHDSSAYDQLCEACRDRLNQRVIGQSLFGIVHGDAVMDQFLNPEPIKRAITRCANGIGWVKSPSRCVI